jgi:hypothetical protein
MFTLKGLLAAVLAGAALLAAHVGGDASASGLAAADHPAPSVSLATLFEPMRH